MYKQHVHDITQTFTVKYGAVKHHSIWVVHRAYCAATASTCSRRAIDDGRQCEVKYAGLIFRYDTGLMEHTQ